SDGRKRGCGGSALTGEALAKVDAPNIRIADDIVRPPLHQNASVVDNVSAIHDVQGFANIMIGDQHADPPILQMKYQFTNFPDRDRVYAGQRLVQKNE